MWMEFLVDLLTRLSGEIILLESGNLIIGAYSLKIIQDHQFKGKFDDIRIYSGYLRSLFRPDKSALRQRSPGSDLSSIIIPAGSTSSVKYIFAEDDEVMGESDETLKVSIDTVTNGNKSNSSTSVDITIKDNDIKPDVTIEEKVP